MYSKKNIEQVAGKLMADGLTTENYTQEKAIAILNNTVAPVFCVKVLMQHEEEIKAIIADRPAHFEIDGIRYEGTRDEALTTFMEGKTEEQIRNSSFEAWCGDHLDVIEQPRIGQDASAWGSIDYRKTIYPTRSITCYNEKTGEEEDLTIGVDEFSELPQSDMWTDLDDNIFCYIPKHILENGTDEEFLNAIFSASGIAFTLDPVPAPSHDCPLSNIDYSQLKAQKAWLLNLPECDEKEGILNLLDAIQDHAVDVLGFDKNVVFTLSDFE